MSRKRILTVFEHQRLRVDGASFRQCHLSALDRWNSRSERRLIEVGRNEVRFSHYVGVIQIGDLTIEVLPKIGRVDEPDHALNRWRVALLDMLEIVGIVRSSAIADAALLVAPRSLLDILFDEYLQRASDIVARGLARAYTSTDANLSALRGRIVLAQHVVQNHVHRERHYCRYDLYTVDTPLNRVLKAATEVVARSSVKPQTSSRAAELLLHFEHVGPCHVAVDHLDSFTLNRKTEHYEGALAIAKLILRGLLPSMDAGADSVVAILFNMNELYELYVLSVFKRMARTIPNLQVRGQRGKRFWEHKLIRPDIEIDYGNRKIIVDTKWKVPIDAMPTDADLKQMFAYNRVFGSGESYLLYPKTAVSPIPRSGTYSEGSGSCTMDYIELFDTENRIRRELNPELQRILATGLSQAYSGGLS